jgi:hypothetical protein
MAQRRLCQTPVYLISLLYTSTATSCKANNIEEQRLAALRRRRLPSCHSLQVSQRFDLLAICCKIREVRGRSAWHAGEFSIRAVAQLGRAPGSGRMPNKYAHLLPRVLSCFFIGKMHRRALSQVFSNAPKKSRRCIKKWIKARTSTSLLLRVFNSF